MKDQTVRVGIVGVGKMGELHLRKFSELPGAEVAGVYDINEERAASVQVQHGVKHFRSLRELLFECDGVVIASPTSTHYQLACQALKMGAHVLVEKPIAEDLNKAHKMVALARKEKLFLQVGLIERYRLMALSQRASLTPVRYAETHRLSPTLSRESDIDVVTDLMIHDLDLVLSLIHEDPIHVSAIGVPVVTNQFDMANVRLEYQNGAVVNLNVSRVSEKPFRKVRIFSLNAYASMDFIENKMKLFYREKDGIHRETFEQQGFDALAAQSAHFVDCIRTGATPAVTGEDGLRALRFAKIIKERIYDRAAWLVPTKSPAPLTQPPLRE